MTVRRSELKWCGILMLTVAALSAGLTAQHKDSRAVKVQDAQDVQQGKEA